MPEHNRPLYTYRGFNARFPTPVEHQPARPSWKCGTCGEDWPCPAARLRLADELGATQLAILMWRRLEEFALDQGEGPLAGAFDRFLRWTRR